MSTGGETIGVAEVQLRVGGAPGFDRAMAAAGASTKALGTTIQSTSQSSGQAWAELFAPPPAGRLVQKSLFGQAGAQKTFWPEENLLDQVRLGPPRPREESPWDKLFAPAKAAQAASAGAASAARLDAEVIANAEERIDKAQQKSILSGRAKAIVISRMSGSASELALSLTTATNRETAWKNALVASSADMAGAIGLIGAMAGGAGGLAVAIGAGLVPALLRMTIGLDDVEERMRKTKETGAQLTTMFQQAQSIRSAAYQGSVEARFGSLKQNADKRRALTKQIDDEQKALQHAMYERDKVLAEAREKRLPSQSGDDMLSSLMGRAKDWWQGNAPGTSIQSSAWLYQKIARWQVDKKDMAAFGPEIAGQTRGSTLESSVDSLSKLLLKSIGARISTDEAFDYARSIRSSKDPMRRLEEVVGEVYLRLFGAAGIPRSIVAGALSPAKEEEAQKEAEPQGAAVRDARAKADASRVELEKLAQGLVPQMQASMLEELDPRRAKKAWIEGERLARTQTLKEAGIPEGDERYRMVDQSAQWQKDETDKGQLAGVMGVGQLHDAIQNMISNSDYARRTADASEAMKRLIEDDIKNRASGKYAANPDGPPAKLVR